ncbi:MAG: hypothetical protein FIB08_17530 [Candidatus Methanoperedens sp.]|nr:hypothetical protein [Candidatus Methanoperedens sp.]
MEQWELADDTMVMGKNKSDNKNSIVKKGLLILAIVIIIILMPTAYASSANASSQASTSNGGSATANSQATASNGGNANSNSQATASNGGNANSNSQATASNGGSATANSLANARNGQSITSNADVTASGSSRTMTVVNGVTTTGSDMSNNKGSSYNTVKTTSRTASYNSSYSSSSTRATTNNVKTVYNQVSSNGRQDGGTVFVGSYKQTNDGRIIRSEEEQTTGYTSSTYRTSAKPKKDGPGNTPQPVKTNDDKNNVISQILKYLRLN